MSELIDNGSGRVEALKEVVLGLHQGQPLPLVKERLKRIVTQCDASEVAGMEQKLIAEGVPVQQIVGMCDLHAQAVRELLVERPLDVPPGHPVDVFRRENAALVAQAALLRAALARLAGGPAGAPADPAALHEAREQLGLLLDVDKHYRRKEHLLFPFLEKRGITGPSTVMWAKDDEVRAGLNALSRLLQDGALTGADWTALAASAGEQALAALEEMAFKEERILLPMCLEQLGEGEWGQVAAQSPEIGFCLVDPVARWVPAGQPEAAPTGPAGALVFPTGALNARELLAIFARLPVDLTYVDAEDRVRFFSEGTNRVFHRAKAVIGRKVQNCHPPASVGTVERILADFRSGAQDVAEFWIQMRGRFVHIRYFALRDEAGDYLGTLEVTQDLTRERALQGDRRLLQYES